MQLAIGAFLEFSSFYMLSFNQAYMCLQKGYNYCFLSTQFNEKHIAVLVTIINQMPGYLYKKDVFIVCSFIRPMPGTVYI